MITVSHDQAVVLFVIMIPIVLALGAWYVVETIRGGRQ